MSWPYCQEPECHNSHTAVYTDFRYNGPVYEEPVGIQIALLDHDLPGWRRWCRTHALLNEGVAFG